MESTGEPTTAIFSANYCPPGPLSFSSVGQVNAASSWTGCPATTTGCFTAPTNYGQLPSYPWFMGQAVVVLDAPLYVYPFTWMHGANVPVAHFPMAGWHKDMYERQPFCEAFALNFSHS